MSKSERDPSRILDAAHVSSRKLLRQFLAERKAEQGGGTDTLQESLRRHEAVLQAIKERRERSERAHGTG